MIHDWTYGNFWNNLIVVKSRKEFTEERISFRNDGEFRDDLKKNKPIIDQLEKVMRKNVISDLYL